MPVMNVSWDDATAFAAWLSSETGKNYRLPTEAEWEYAARAGTNTAFHTGERITREQANYNGSITYSGSLAQARATRAAAVGLYPANAFGLHDMHGNVNEFTCSTYSGNYDGAESTCNQFGDNRDYVSRGGGWSSAPADIRSAARSRGIPDRKYFYLGFRIAIGDTP